jgi:hypothetical protein
MFILLIRSLWNSRLQLLFVVFVVAVLSIGQGRELSLSLQGTLQYASLLAILSVAVFTVQLWLWTYISVLTAPARSSPSSAAPPDIVGISFSRQTAASYVATGYSAVILLVVTYEFFSIGEATSALSVAFTNVLIVIYVVVSSHAGSRGSDHPDHQNADGKSKRRAYIKPILKTSAILSIASMSLLYLFWIFIPQSQAYVLGSFGSFFLSISILSAWASLFFILARPFRVPAILVLIAVPFFSEAVYSALGLHAHLYAVRELNEGKVPSRPGLEVALSRWRDQDGAASSTRPIVFVTTAGGGVRAAYWTAAVLGRLEDCVPDFHKSMFSISAVSGGSLGAAAFTTLVSDQTQSPRNSANCTPPIKADEAREMGSHQKFLRVLLSQDYLAPVVRELLIGDVARSLLPWSSRELGSIDRGIVLEQSWERAWRIACDSREIDCSGRTSFETSFAALHGPGSWLPHLFLNGVHEETGKRLITSSAHVVAEKFIDAIDFFDLVNHDVRISTAVLNSARFPIISPSGSLLRRVPPTKAVVQSRGAVPPTNNGLLTVQSVGHVIDGGYFDNNGTITSQEIASSTLSQLKIGYKSSGCTKETHRRNSIFIEILNDTELSELDNDRKGINNEVNLADRLKQVSSQRTYAPLHQLLTAFRGLESSREARAVYSSKQLAKFADAFCDGYYFEIPLCTGLLPRPALGWTLSAESRKAMDELLVGGIDSARYVRSSSRRDFYDCYANIQRKIEQIVDLLASGARTSDQRQ